jgi:Ca2+/Na+ antiporter
MIILKTIAVGILIILISPWLGFLVMLLPGLIVEPIAGRKLSGLRLIKFRYFWQFGWRGFTAGVLNALAIYFWNLNILTFIVLFAAYVVFFMKHKTEYALNRLAEGDVNEFNRISRKTETITFISYVIGLCFIVGA